MRAFYRQEIQKGFLPLPDRDGAVQPYSDRINMLARRTAGREQFLILADGDALPDEEFAAYLTRQGEALQQTPGPVDFLVLFAFDGEPNDAKTRAMRDAALNWTMNRKFVTVIAARLDEKRLEQFRKVPGGHYGVHKAARAAFEAWNVTLGDEQELIRRQQEKLAFSYRAKKPVVTWILVALNVLIFLAMSLYCVKTGVSSDAALDIWGSKDNLLIMQGQYWRFLTAMFLHANIEHIAFNAFSLYFVGLLAERIYGHGRFAAIYLLAGLCGNIASFAFSANSSVGASGAIFGIMGMLVYFGIEKPAVFRSSFGVAILFIIVINLVNGAVSTDIDNFCHVGGLIGGFLFAGALYPGRGASRARRLVPAAAGVAVTAGVLFYGFTNARNTAQLLVARLEQLKNAQQWTQTEQLGKQILGRRGVDADERDNALWDICIAQLNLRENGTALATAKQLTAVDAVDGHYLQGLVDLSLGQPATARQELTAAKKLGASYSDIDELLQQIQNSGK